MAQVLTVASLPTAAMAFTNAVYVAENIAEYVMVNQKHAYRCIASPAITPGCVAMNSLQRDCCKVSLGASVPVEPFFYNTNDNAYSIEFDVDSIGKRRVEVSEDALVDYIRKYDCKLFFNGGVFCIDYEGNPLKLSTRKIRVVSTDASDAEQDIELRASEYGVVTPDTRIEIFFDEKNGSRLLTFKKSEGKRASPIFDANWRFEDMGIGGLDKEFSTIFRRSFASRLLPPKFVEQLGIKHVKGMLLYGPPGTGKTLIARQIGKMLGGNEPKIVNGPEILNKFVGQAEENIRNLFADAIKDYEQNKENAGLHVIIFDEIDAICKARGSVRSGTGVHDTVVNQLLTMIDGINTPNNILVIGMTNRKDMLDPALLRPGRLEVHVEISLPDTEGRVQILKIHTKAMRENGMLAPDVDLPYIAAHTRNFSGAEIEGLVKSATSYAIASAVDVKNVSLKDNYTALQVTMEHFQMALEEIKPSFGVDEDEIKAFCRGDIIQYSPEFTSIVDKVKHLIASLHADPTRSVATVLLQGAAGSGKTTLAAKMALESGFPFAKLVAPQNYVGLSESGKAAEIASVFDQAYKSPLSVILIDNLETLLEYVPIGPRFSNVMLQTFLTLLNRPHPKPDRKLLVLATTSQFSVLRQMQMRSAFDFIVEVPRLTMESDIKRVLLSAGVPDCPALDDIVRYDIPAVGIKQLLLVVKMAMTGVAGVNREAFREWLVDCGVGLKTAGVTGVNPDEEYEY